MPVPPDEVNVNWVPKQTPIEEELTITGLIVKISTDKSDVPLHPALSTLTV